MQFVPQKFRDIANRYKKTDEEVKEYQDSIELEKGDLPAMIIAAIITFLPVAIVAMVVIYGLIWIIMQ